MRVPLKIPIIRIDKRDARGIWRTRLTLVVSEITFVKKRNKTENTDLKFTIEEDN